MSSSGPPCPPPACFLVISRISASSVVCIPHAQNDASVYLKVSVSRESDWLAVLVAMMLIYQCSHPTRCLDKSRIRNRNTWSEAVHAPLTFGLGINLIPKTRRSTSLIPRLPDLFNVAREKRGSLVKLITCMTSSGTNFHIWHNSKLAKIKATDAKSSSSSISMLQSAMNQQAETLQSLF